MNVIVCFGDSNTWGFKPETIQSQSMDNRFSYEERWTGRLQKLLGDNFKVEEEGLNGRTTAFDDPFNPNVNGLKFIDCCLQTNAPVDLLIITLGTNDSKEYFGVSAFHIAMGLEQLILKAQNGQFGPEGGNPKILIISPQHLHDNFREIWPGEIFSNGSLEKTKALSKEYRRIAGNYNCHFLDVADSVKSSELDGVHLDAANHEKFAKLVFDKVCQIFSGT